MCFFGFFLQFQKKDSMIAFYITYFIGVQREGKISMSLNKTNLKRIWKGILNRSSSLATVSSTVQKLTAVYKRKLKNNQYCASLLTGSKVTQCTMIYKLLNCCNIYTVQKPAWESCWRVEGKGKVSHLWWQLINEVHVYGSVCQWCGPVCLKWTICRSKLKTYE